MRRAIRTSDSVRPLRKLVLTRDVLVQCGSSPGEVTGPTDECTNLFLICARPVPGA